MTDHNYLSYRLSDDPAQIDVRAVYEFLTHSYWASGITVELVQRAMRNSLCVGAYARDGSQVGFARFISDYTTYCYVCDVYVLKSERGHGLGKEMIAFAHRHPRLQGLRRWMLVTKDAQGVYSQLGFKPLAYPERHMEINILDIYQRTVGSALS